jgi:CheY-like chemotaxis protein
MLARAGEPPRGGKRHRTQGSVPEDQTREALTRLLTKGGAEGIAVSTAEKALEAFKYEAPDVIISDIALPGDDGYHFLQMIRSLETEQNLPATPAIALTALAGPKDRRLARESGFHQHLAKPVDPAVLIAVIAELTAQGRNTAADA